MMSLTIDLREFEPVGRHIREDSPVMGQLCELLDAAPDTCVDLFCREIQSRLDHASARDLHVLNPTKNKPNLFSRLGSVWWTQGYVGVLQFDLPWKRHPEKPPLQMTLNIRSRFDRGTDSSFLLYVFEKTYGAGGTLYDRMRIPGYTTKTWDLLLTSAFVQQLHNAMKQGLLRQYRDREYNDNRLRGRMDIARHLRENPLFSGKTAYTSREYTVDNPVNILILRAFDRLDRDHHLLLRSLIAKDDVIRQGIQFLKAEIPDWQRDPDYVVLRNADRRIVQNVYRNYEPLRKTSAAVLRRMGVNAFVRADSTITGLLIDMPDLWEQFLYNAVFREYTGGQGPYRQKSYGIVGGKRSAKPDFLLREQGIVLDAKYKVHWADTLAGGDWESLRDDTYQIISYALIFNCTCCGVIFPVAAGAAQPESGDPLLVPISEDCPDRFFVRIPYCIPQAAEDGDSYRKAFERSDRAVLDTLKKLEETVRSSGTRQQPYDL